MPHPDDDDDDMPGGYGEVKLILLKNASFRRSNSSTANSGAIPRQLYSGLLMVG